MTKATTAAGEKKKTGLDLLREPFPPNQISKLPKPTKFQTEEVRKDFKNGVRCEICGGWHHPKVVHLDYVGHAALTDRLLDCDPGWNWEPVATNENGTPSLDNLNGMWIRLTVCDLTRLGYGHSEGKEGGDAIKETIGDAMRNAAMRFGAALDLWHKGDLHAIEADEGAEDKPAENKPRNQGDRVGVGEKVPDPIRLSETAIVTAITAMQTMQTISDLQTCWNGLGRNLQHDQRVIDAKEDQKTAIMERPE